MKSRSGLFILLVVIVLVLAACGGGAPATTSPPEFIEPAATEPPATQAPVFEAPSFAEEQAAKDAGGIPQDQAAQLAPMPTGAVYEISNASGDLTVIERSNRMIIKNADVRLMVKCSPGTYIRSIAHDLGAALGVGGHLIELRRLASGTLDEPIRWDMLLAAIEDGTWQQYLIDERKAIPHVPELHLSHA